MSLLAQVVVGKPPLAVGLLEEPESRRKPTFATPLRRQTAAHPEAGAGLRLNRSGADAPEEPQQVLIASMR